jgi:hypothetical protein
MVLRPSILQSLEAISALGFHGTEICVENKDWSVQDINTFPVEAIKDKTRELPLAMLLQSASGLYL